MIGLLVALSAKPSLGQATENLVGRLYWNGADCTQPANHSVISALGECVPNGNGSIVFTHDSGTNMITRRDFNCTGCDPACVSDTSRRPGNECHGLTDNQVSTLAAPLPPSAPREAATTRQSALEAQRHVSSLTCCRLPNPVCNRAWAVCARLVGQTTVCSPTPNLDGRVLHRPRHLCNDDHSEPRLGRIAFRILRICCGAQHVRVPARVLHSI